MKLLIVYGTTEGQTRKICEFIRDKAKQNGHTVSLNDSTQAHLHPEGFDAVIIASSIHAEKFQDSISHYVQEHHETLNRIPGVFMVVSLTAATNEPESWKELEEITNNFLNRTGWHPEYVEQVAGALRYTKYNFLKKFIMRMIAQKHSNDVDTSKDYEYTDWEQVGRILKKLEKNVSESEKVSK